jgi:hypothetical protein
MRVGDRAVVGVAGLGEARATSGRMGNWTEITVTDGKKEETASGRTGELTSAIEAATEPIFLDLSDEYVARYGPFGSGSPT